MITVVSAATCRSTPPVRCETEVLAMRRLVGQGIADQQRDACILGNARDRLDVADDAARVGQALDEEGLGVFGNGAFEVLRLVGIDDRGRALCAERIWRELLAGSLDDSDVVATWGGLTTRDRLHRGLSAARLAFDAAWAAAANDGPWWVPVLEAA